MWNKKDLTDQRFGRLTVIGDSGQRNYGQVIWTCKCDCGNTANVPGRSLTRGATKSCGCLRVDDLCSRRIDLTGCISGKLTAISALPGGKWICRCECGKTAEVATNHLRGKTRSCGCLRRERVKAMMNGREIVHAMLSNMRLNSTNDTAWIRLARKTNKNSSTGVKGVCPRGKKYRAYITLRRQQINLGIFDTVEEATNARRSAEICLFGPVIEE